ncbi:hypothetical protein KCTC52924_03267 [Arenibacter antarcticus]|uniref:Uncharacterized protein n=1 Tax=Arenibacter antarcticus TaxID=2040469 RepID=A0ABW5VF26_9FLAO|nr:hypothetical protein [Arenibacter sp. H213]MCM4166336.1 hypothetical protein [Arenibacter sp. H213]
MKTNKDHFMIWGIALLLFCSITYAQTTHIVTLHVDMDGLNQGNNKKAFSFSVSEGTQVADIDDPEAFTIFVNENDEIEWEGESSSGAEVNIEEIEIMADSQNPNRKDLFNNKKIKGNKGHGDNRKKIKAKIKEKTKDNVYKYIIRFSIEGDLYEIDPKIKV